MKHHHRPETQEHIAMAVMTKEAEQITTLIVLRRALEVRRNNLMATITALEDRVSAIQGLIRLDRPYVAHRMH